jgi:hypothetical protein
VRTAILLDGRSNDPLSASGSAQELPQAANCRDARQDGRQNRQPGSRHQGHQRSEVEHPSPIKGVRNIKTDIPMQKARQSNELPV